MRARMLALAAIGVCSTLLAGVLPAAAAPPSHRADPPRAHAAYLYKAEAKTAARRRIREDARNSGALHGFTIDGCRRHRATLIGCDYWVSYYNDSDGTDWECDGTMMVRETRRAYVTWTRGSDCWRSE